MEIIVEEQIFKEYKQKNNLGLSNGYKFMRMQGYANETQSISQRILDFSRVDNLTLKNIINQFSNSSYLEIKRFNFPKNTRTEHFKNIFQIFNQFQQFYLKGRKFKKLDLSRQNTFNKPKVLSKLTITQIEKELFRIQSQEVSLQIFMNQLFKIQRLAQFYSFKNFLHNLKPQVQEIKSKQLMEDVMHYISEIKEIFLFKNQ